MEIWGKYHFPIMAPTTWPPFWPEGEIDMAPYPKTLIMTKGMNVPSFMLVPQNARFFSHIAWTIHDMNKYATHISIDMIILTGPKQSKTKLHASLRVISWRWMTAYFSAPAPTGNSWFSCRHLFRLQPHRHRREWRASLYVDNKIRYISFIWWWIPMPHGTILVNTIRFKVESKIYMVYFADW